jgi:hypothetical protein
VLTASIRKLFEVAVALAAMSCISVRFDHAERAPGVTFTKIADTNTLIPAGQLAGEKFSQLGGFDNTLPAIDHGSVVFVGKPETAGSSSGLYKWEHGALGSVADPSTPRPGGGEPFGGFNYPTMRDGEYAFESHGIFRTVQGQLTNVVNLSGWSTFSLDGSAVWFANVTYPPAVGTAMFHLYRMDGDSTIAIANSGEDTPSAPGFRFTFMTTTAGLSDTYLAKSKYVTESMKQASLSGERDRMR